MKDTLTPHAKRLYRICTPKSERWALYALPGSLLVTFYVTMLLGGVAMGAGAAVTGDSLTQTLSSIHAAKFELWMEFANTSVTSQIIFGVLYPIIGLTWAVFTIGVHLGFAVPQLGYVVDALGLLWPVVGFAFIGMQAIRFASLHTE